MIPVKNKINTVPSQQPKTQVLEKEFELFTKEKKLLANVTWAILQWYQSSWIAYQRYLEAEKIEDKLSRIQINGLYDPPQIAWGIERISQQLCQSG